MPCYTQWDAYLAKGSSEYESKKSELHAKLMAAKHIVNYYYGTEGLHVPPARHSGQGAWIEMADLDYKIDLNDLEGINEEKLIEKIAHHCTCGE